MRTNKTNISDWAAADATLWDYRDGLVVFGSSALTLQGLDLKRPLGDFDIFASSQAFEAISNKHGGGDGTKVIVRMLNGSQIDVANAFPGVTFQEAKRGAKYFYRGAMGIASINSVVQWKMTTNREKDRRDIELCRQHLLKPQKPELHLMIVWSNAENYRDHILNHLKCRMKVFRTYEFTWSADKFSDCMSLFYAQHLPRGSHKETHCGRGPFTLIVFKDENPNYQFRLTSRGVEFVNANTYDLKEEYRALTGGGHKIHATNNELETNHDLSLLFGQSLEEYRVQHSSDYDGSFIKICRDIDPLDCLPSLIKPF